MLVAVVRSFYARLSIRAGGTPGGEGRKGSGEVAGEVDVGWDASLGARED